MADRTGWVNLDVDDGSQMRAFVARPDGAGPHPGMLVIQEALGVNTQLRGVCERYAEIGFVAIAPDMFHRTSAGFETDKFETDKFMPLIRALTIDGMIADVRAAYAWLTSQPDVDRSRVAAVGFCMGGRATYLANSELPLTAAISYYGGSIAPNLLDRAAKLHGPHLFIWGGQDKGIPPEQHRAVADAVRAAGKSFIDVEFSDANHGFFNDQVADRYDADAAAESWALVTSFLDRTVGRR